MSRRQDPAPGTADAREPRGPDLVTLLDEIQSLARTGLHFADDPYDRERYERLLALATRGYGDVAGIAEDAVRTRFAAEVGQITPKVGADGAIFDADDRILLVLRTDDSTWGLPAGWVEPGEHPAQTVVREVEEEVGLVAEVERLVDLVARPAGAGYGPHAVLSVVYLCRVTGGALRLQAHEVMEARWWPVDDVPVWHHDHERLARVALAARRGT